ncbi:MAG TPA: PEGA domain-containing protein [Kofleriaceae bacterium]
MVNMRHHILLVLGATLVAGVAYADTKLNEARSHLEIGIALYDENHFRGALVEFQRAYELVRSYKILFNIAQVEMMLQDYAAALDAYTRYLEDGGPDITPERTAQVIAELARLKDRVGFLIIQTAPGAEVLVDDLPVGRAPLPSPVAVAAGRHRVTVNPPQREPITRVVDVPGRENVRVALALDAPAVASIEPPSQKAPEPPSDGGPSSAAPMYVAWSITAGLAIGAGVFALNARGDANDLAALRARYPVTPDQFAAQRSKTVRAATISDGLAAAAVVSAAVALYVTLKRRRHEPRPTHASALELQIAPSGVAVAGRF